MNSIGVIILAAGSSSRMSSPKQLLKFQDETLLRKSVMTALSIDLPTVTVLGANFKQHKREIADLHTEVVFNLDWRKGMGSSLKQGLCYLHKNYPRLEGALIMVCDQPMLGSEVLLALIDEFRTGRSIVASSYDGVLGVPALFPRECFKELLKIPDGKGAKILLDKYGAHAVNFPEGKIDIDTDADWHALQNRGDVR